MNRALSLLLGVVVSSSIAFAVEDTLPKAIKTQYKAVEKAVNTCNMKAFEKFFTADYVSIDPEGKSTNRADFLKGIGEMLGNYKSGTMKEKFSKVVKKGDTYEVSLTFEGVMSGKNGKLSIKEVCTDYWRKDKGVWKMFKTVDTAFDMKEIK